MSEEKIILDISLFFNIKTKDINTNINLILIENKKMLNFFLEIYEKNSKNFVDVLENNNYGYIRNLIIKKLNPFTFLHKMHDMQRFQKLYFLHFELQCYIKFYSETKNVLYLLEANKVFKFLQKF